MRRRRPLRSSVVAVAVAALAALAAGTLPATHAAAAPARPWRAAAGTPAQRADALLAQMTTAEKITMMHGGAQCSWGACVDANTRLGIPQLRLQDGPAGVADGAGGVTQLPAPVAAAASWDRDLAKSYGQVIGNEAWNKGANVVLGPTINIVRDPRWGRAFESLSEDPYLAGELGAADIRGIQSQGPMAQVKHYADYNQETNRNNPQDNVIMSDRTQREIYLPAFEAAVKQGQAYSVMCSYATVAGTYACENAQLMQQVLEGDLGFAGFITSDWGGTHSTVASANAGLDQEMNGSDFYGTALTNAVSSGQVSAATLDGHVRRILTSMFASGLFDTTQTGAITTPVSTDAHKATARQVAEEGSVLLKNAGSALPLGTSNRKIAVIGDDAGANTMSAGGGSAHVGSSSVVTPYSALVSRAGSGASVTYSQGYSSPGGEIVDSANLTPSQGTGPGLYGQFYNGTALAGAPIASGVDPTINFLWGGASPKSPVPATSWSAKWTGTLTPPSTGTYTFSVSSDDGSRLFVNGQQIISNWADQPRTTKTGTVSLTAGQPVSIEVDYFQDGGGSELELGWLVPNQDLHGEAVTAARNADTAVVFVDKGEGEGADLGDIDLSAEQNQLVTDVAAANPDTIVVVNTGSAVTMPWANDVRGIVENWYPGQEDGNALAALLYGDVNFSGKLPVTFPQSLADVPAHTAAQWPGQSSTVQYSEGVDVGYRWYDSQNKTPLYPFGFGLSYTTFAFSGLTVGRPDASGGVAVGFDVKNTGTRAGADVAQVYVSQPAATGEPPKSLRGFQRVSLDPGQSRHVTLTLDARSFQYWNNGWTDEAGTDTVSVGDSSRSTPLTGTTTIGGGTPPPATTAISLRAHANGQYVTAENAGAAPLIANRTAIGPWETFDESDLGGGQVSLRAHANNDYVTAPNNGAGSLIASSTSVGTAETFDLIHNADGSVSLRAHANSQYVTAENAGAAALIANRTAIGPWEEFDLIKD